MEEKQEATISPLRFVWLDAYEGDCDWYDLGDYDAPEREMVTYGYPFSMNNYYLSVASTCDPDGGHYAVVINIPWGMLSKITTIPEDGQLPVSINVQTLRQTILRYQQQQD